MVTDGKPERYLDLVHKALSKDSDITERNKSILKDLLEGLCKEMTNDRLFALIFNNCTTLEAATKGCASGKLMSSTSILS